MSEVLICRTTDRASFTSKALKYFSNLFNGVERVFIKPNIVSHEHYPTTTHPQTLRAVLESLSSLELLVGDGPAVDIVSSHRVLEKHPLTQVCRECGYEMLNIYNHEMRKFRTCRGYKFKASTLPLGCDITISLPVGKEHFVCTFTGSLKNQFGLLSRLDRILMHSGIKDIHRGIAELNTLIRPQLIIMDMVETLLEAQERRHGGKPVKAGYMLAGTDPVAVDKAAIDILAKLNGRIRRARGNVEHVELSVEYGVGKPEYRLIWM